MRLPGRLETKAESALAVDKGIGQILKNELGVAYLRCKMTLDFSVLLVSGERDFYLQVISSNRGF